ncbi:MAG TPA: SRPBCC family protein [Verrucomicrobiae bacterium]|jgi:uncharacterized protein YndB with AHSA1/START domain|nr:SRPBCC family protein [Verrucomicrobiae bacterium]
MKILLLIIPVLVLGFILLVAARPAFMKISRSAKIAAPPAMVFPLVNDFHQWQAWSPWAKLDPAAANSYQGPDSGVGAAFAWSGNNKVGAGRMLIKEARPNELIRIQLEFLRPMKVVNTAEFTFRSEGGGTLVSWTMTGKNNFAAKVFGLFVNCDKMVGGDFERGLAAMKSIAEKKSGVPA